MRVQRERISRALEAAMKAAEPEWSVLVLFREGEGDYIELKTDRHYSQAEIDEREAADGLILILETDPHEQEVTRETAEQQAKA